MDTDNKIECNAAVTSFSLHSVTFYDWKEPFMLLCERHRDAGKRDKYGANVR